MLTIRAPQMNALSEANTRLFIGQMRAHLGEHFPALAAASSAAGLDAQISACLARARRYGLNSQRDACRFLNLAATYGWEFDQDPVLPWMRRYLEDAGVSSASDRLEALIRHCMHRAKVEAGNRRLRDEMKSLSLRSAQPLDQPEELLRAAALPARGSRALGMPDAIGDTHPSEVQAWTDDARPLLRN